MPLKYTTGDISRFWLKVHKTDTCWLWTAGTNGVGYGYFGLHHDQPITAHRFAYELTYGPLDDGVCVLHRCDNPPCCNPDHLFLGTRKDNADDKVSKGRQAQGEQHGIAKMSADDVRFIRERYAAGGISMKKLGAQCGISKSEVFYIVHRKVWDHI
jgi:hypothetical protein